jgi:hypothetical protein
VALVVVDGLQPMARPELIERVARQPPVVGERRDVVVHGAAVDIGVSPFDEPGDEIDHRRDVIGGPGIDLGRHEIEPLAVAMERRLVLGRDLGRREPLVGRRQQHLVLAAVVDLVGHVPDVGDVHHLPDGNPGPDQHPADQVTEQERPQVPDVDGPVDGGPAGVHRNRVGPQRSQRLHRSGQRVVKAQHRRPPSHHSGLAPR